jgi:hypothetical protein
VDLTFGDYFRALITADSDAVPEDPRGYRIAFVEAFRRRGIYPHDVRTLSVESLRWSGPSEDPTREVRIQFVRNLPNAQKLWGFSRSRAGVFAGMKRTRAKLHQKLLQGLSANSEEFARFMRIDPTLPFEIHSLRPCVQIGPDGEGISQWIVEITQRRREYLDGQPGPTGDDFDILRPHFTFRGGSTWIVDADTGLVRYVVEKRIDSKARLERHRSYLNQVAGRSLLRRARRRWAGRAFCHLASGL